MAESAIKYLTVRKAARKMGVTPSRVYKLIEEERDSVRDTLGLDAVVNRPPPLKSGVLTYADLTTRPSIFYLDLKAALNTPPEE